MGILEHGMRRTWRRHTWFLFWLRSSSAMSLGLSFLICKLWALTEARVSRQLAPWLRLFLSMADIARQSWCSFHGTFAPGSPLVLEAKPIYCLDETTWIWTPLYLWWFEFYPVKSLQRTLCPMGCWCWLQVHVSCTRPLTADVLLFTPPSLRLALLSAWPLIFPGVQGPIQMPLPLWNPSLNPPCSISHFFCCSHSTVPINYNASEMAMVLILKPGALRQTSL